MLILLGASQVMEWYELLYGKFKACKQPAVVVDSLTDGALLHNIWSFEADAMSVQRSLVLCFKSSNWTAMPQKKQKNMSFAKAEGVVEHRRVPR